MRKYSGGISDYEFTEGILTGISDSVLDLDSDPVLKGRWSYLPYHDIAERILEIATASETKVIKDNLSLIREYCDVIVAIEDVLKNHLEATKNKFDNKWHGKLEELRIMAQVKPQTTSFKDTDEAYAYFASDSVGWFDDSYHRWDNRTIFGRATTMKPRNGIKYDSYKGDSYWFLYQYFDIAQGIDYSTLMDEAKEYLRKAAEIINSGMNVG